MDHLALKPGEGPRILWVACGTKMGKTLGASAGYAHAVPKYPGTTSRWVAPIFKQTNIAWNYLSKIWPGDPYVTKHKVDMMMKIPSKDIVSEFWHGVHPEDLEGAAVKIQVNDEAAKLKEQVFISSNTTWTFTQAQVINISTPRGRNWFYKGCMRAKDEMARAKREKRIPREMFISAPTIANPYVPRESIEEARRLLPARLFQQYYEAAFLDNGSVFPRLQVDKEFWKAEYIKDGPVEYWLAPGCEKMTVVAGCDWAKRQDYTVLILIDHTQRPFRIVGFMRFHQKKYTEQVIDIVRFMRKFKEVEILYHDRTGVGDAIDDMLSEVPGLIYQGIVFSNANKAEMVNSLITGVEQTNIVFPNWPEMIHEFDVYEVETDSIGRMRYNAAEGSHDDIVTGTFLAYAAAEQYAEKDFEIKFLEELPGEEFQKSTWANYMSESLDFDVDEGF